MADLYERLRQSRGRSLAAAAGGRTPAAGCRSFINLDGWEQVDDLVFRRVVAASGVGLPAFSRLLDRPLAAGGPVFLDTETTGLSGGAGTVVFLAGVGTWSREAVRVTQLLLGDYPGERAFLLNLAPLLEAGAVRVSYNGKAFDSPLLATRYLMNGLPVPGAIELDLLYPARRLWKRLIGSCSLGDIEREVLDTPREDDVDGAEIPGRYFSFLAARDGRMLEEVFEHHRLDVMSLVRLFGRIETVLAEPAGSHPVDRYELGRWLLRRGDTEAAVACLRAFLDDPVGAEGAVLPRAAVLLARLHRAMGRMGEAARVLEHACSAGEPSAAAAVELAKLHEHALRSPKQALRAMETLLERDPSALSPGVLHRMDRLRRKLDRGPR